MIKKVLVAAIVLTTLSFTLVERTTYKSDVSESKVEWVGYKAAGQHNGVIEIKEGSLVVDNDMVVSGNFMIDMNSIKILDTDNKKLLKHLRSGDFFDVEKFQTAAFVISNSSTIGDKTIVKGNITIKGITEAIEFPAIIFKNDNGQLILESETFKIDRTKFNITYKSKTVFNKLKDKFIYDEFDMKVKVVLSETE